MPEFCKEFGYTCEQDALTSTEISKSARTVLIEEYEAWRRNEGADYWASRTVEYKIEVSTKKTAGDLVDRGRCFTRKLLLKRPRDGAK
ncbi:hypothetical protein BGZ58_001661, partial [Dissophora ornata]